MRHEVKKISRIVDELVTFFLKRDSKDLEIGIRRLEDRTVMRLVVRDCELEPGLADQLSEVLNIQRQYEVEEYYWQLAGENDCESEISLVGTMVDFAVVETDNGNLIMELTRMND